MNKAAWASLLALAFVAGFLIFYRPASNPAPQNTQSTSSQQALKTKADEQANVTVVVTPKDVSSQSAKWTFDVGMNTHSVELDQDMTKIAVLIDDQGKGYAPTDWDGPVGGHHREGILTFNRPDPLPRTIRIKISGIGDVTRTFNWDIQR